MGGINGADGIQNIIEVLSRITFTGNQQDPFVSGLNEMACYFANLLLSKDPLSYILVPHKKREIWTVVLATV